MRNMQDLTLKKENGQRKKRVGIGLIKNVKPYAERSTFITRSFLELVDSTAESTSQILIRENW